jgi:PQQ-dependent catabolism-associated CXXCW motif protein
VNRRSLLGAVAGLPFACGTLALDSPPEPDGYRLDAYRTPTPATLAGATVLTNEAAYALWADGKAAFIDVLPQPKRPDDLAPGTLWRDMVHHSIPRAIWLPNTGFGQLAPVTEEYLRGGLRAATSGDVDHRLVFFCQRDCWMSWNAAKRALEYGYRAVSWYPDGTDGWRESGRELVRAEPYREP